MRALMCDKNERELCVVVLPFDVEVMFVVIYILVGWLDAQRFHVEVDGFAHVAVYVAVAQPYQSVELPVRQKDMNATAQAVWEETYSRCGLLIPNVNLGGLFRLRNFIGGHLAGVLRHGIGLGLFPFLLRLLRSFVDGSLRVVHCFQGLWVCMVRTVRACSTFRVLIPNISPMA